MTVCVQTFGPFRVTVADRTVDDHEWPGNRSKQLVQLLAVSPGHRLVRDQVIEALWPHLDAAAGGANLRKAAHHARKALGDPDAVVLRGGQVLLAPDGEVDADLDRFRAAAATALGRGDAAACLAAAALARAELLPDARYEEWAAEPRRDIRRTRLSLLRTARAWEEVLALDPTDEAAHQELMRTALAAGARAEALRWFERLREELATELGVRPGAASRALYDEAVAGLAASATTLVGREQELGVAVAALRAQSPPCGAISVRGPAGVGKSALCRRVAELAAEEGRAVQWADTAGPDRAFGPLVTLLEELILDPRQLLDRVPDHVASVAAALSELAPEADPVEGPLSRHQVLGAVGQLLRAAAEGRPTVLVVDDAHDADVATLDVLTQLAGSTPDVAVVLSFRPETAPAELSADLARLERSRRAVAIDLEPLRPGHATDLVRSAAAQELPPPTVERIVDLAEGNPFALIELARHADTAEGPLPRSVADAVTSRLVGLDADTVDRLQRLALASGDLDSTLVTALVAASEAEAFALLDRALDAGVLVVAGGRYRFRHDLVRQALIARVPPHRQALVHRDAAEALIEAGAPAEAIAGQWLSGGRPEEAVDWSLAAAADAMRVGAFQDARRHLAPVLEHDPSHALALRLDAESLDMLGEPEALAAYDAAIAVAPSDVAEDLAINRALAQIKQGDPEGGLAAIRGATPHSPLARLNEALAYAGAAALGATDPELGTRKAAEVRRIALEVGDEAGIVIAAWAHAAAAHARGDLADSVLGDLRETKDLPVLATRVFDGHLCMTQRFLYGSRPYEEVLTFAEALTAEADRLGALRGRAFGHTLRGEALMLSGHLQESRAEFDVALPLHRQTGGTTGEAHAMQRLADLTHFAGAQAEAAARIGDALELARVSDIGFHLFDRIYGSRIRIAPDPDEALAAVEEAEAAVHGPLESCPGCRVHLAVPAAIAAARAGDLERAHRYQEQVDYLANVVMRLPAFHAAFDEVNAHVALAEGDRERARGLFAAAAAGYAAANHPIDQERCLSEI